MMSSADVRVLLTGDRAVESLELEGLGFYVLGAARSGAEAFATCREYYPDVLLDDLVQPELDGISLIKRLKTARFKSLPSVLVASYKGMERFDECALSLGAYDVIKHPFGARELAEKLRLACPTNRLEPVYASTARIKRVLTGLGVPMHLKGYDYLVDAVRLTCRSEFFRHRLSAVVYASVAQLNGTSRELVERSIRNAIEVAWSRGVSEHQYAFFGNTIDEERGKPTNGAFIARVAEALRLEEA